MLQLVSQDVVVKLGHKTVVASAAVIERCKPSELEREIPCKS